MKISDILQMKAGVSGLDVTGTIKAVYDPKEHDGDYGKWYSQNLLIADGEDKIYISLSKKQLTKEWVGKTITFDKCKVGEYKGKDGNMVKNILSGWTGETKQAEKKPEHQEAKQTSSGSPDWDGKERRSLRAMCLAYAKDIAVSRIQSGLQFSTDDIISLADYFSKWVYGEVGTGAKDVHPEVVQDKEEITIPF